VPAAKLEMGRPNQRLRTRKDLLQAAARLTKSGTKPSLEDVAEEALVSRATAYRYFPSIEALLLEAALDIATPQAPDVFNGAPADDPIARLERLDLAFDEMMNANEATLRLFLASGLTVGRGQQPHDERDQPAFDDDGPQHEQNALHLRYLLNTQRAPALPSPVLLDSDTRARNDALTTVIHWANSTPFWGICPPARSFGGPEC